jgi:hypothetical protein
MLTIVDPSFRILKEALEDAGKYLKPNAGTHFDEESLKILRQGLPKDLAEAIFTVLTFNEGFFR